MNTRLVKRGLVQRAIRTVGPARRPSSTAVLVRPLRPGPGPALGLSLGLSLGLAFGATMIDAAHAAGPGEMNVRQGVGNGSMNKIASARLQGMLAGQQKGRGGRAGEDDCSTQIGNREQGGSLLDRPTDVIIVGDVINVCQ